MTALGKRVGIAVITAQAGLMGSMAQDASSFGDTTFVVFGIVMVVALAAFNAMVPGLTDDD